MTLMPVSRSTRRVHHTHRTLSSPWATVGALVIAVVWTVPTLGLFISSIRPASQITTSGWWTFFAHPQTTMDNYSATMDFVSSGITVTQALVNSLTITIPATVLPITLALMVAYALAWIDFRGRHVLFVAIFSLQIVPLQMLLVPLLKLYSGGVVIAGTQIIPGFPANSLGSGFAQVWITHAMSALPLATFMFHNALATIPVDIMEAAQIDGAGHGQIFRRLAMPLVLPTIASYAIFQFLWVWNDLLVATIFTSGRNAPVTKILADLSGVYGQQWYLLTAGTFVAIVVPLIVFFALQRFFVRGLLAGSTKG
ncbi:MAG: carbohydrate ABC transporter permease [Propionibacteriaceae bacterium]|nr:carbohydrate ABC transporter permease [Propionibacteriaceae bacterium]